MRWTCPVHFAQITNILLVVLLIYFLEEKNLIKLDSILLETDKKQEEEFLCSNSEK